MPSVTKILRSLRIIFAVLALVTVLIYLSWHSQSGLWQRVEQQLRVTHNDQLLIAYDQAIALSDSSGYERLMLLMADLETVQKADALDGLKRRVFSSLVTRSPSDAEALEWASRWLAYDDRSINARLTLASLKTALPDQRGEGAVLFDQLRSRFPELIEISANQASVLYDAGEKLAAFRAATDLLDRDSKPDSLNWRLVFYLANGEIREQFLSLGFGQSSLDMGLPADTYQVSLHCGEKVPLSLSKVSMQAGDDVLELQTNLTPRQGDTGAESPIFKDFNEQADFVWSFQEKQTGTVRITLSIEPTRVRVLHQLAADDELAQLVRQSGTAEDQAWLALLRSGVSG